MRSVRQSLGLAWRLTPLGLLFLWTSFFPVETAIAVAVRSEVVITSGLALPIYAAAPAGDFDHLYIAEGTGARLKRLNLTTNVLTTMLDLPNAAVGSQAGLNGFAFHPDYANNGKIYVNYSNVDEISEKVEIEIREYTLSETDPNAFDIDSERKVLTVPNPSGSHNGGWIEFGPDDYLYMATGDGGNVPPAETKGLPAQDLNSLKGKMLRIDVDGDDFLGDATRNYAIPPTNPFATGGGAPEVFAWGLRHAFRNGFDRDTGDLYIADVGSRFYEEINFLPEGTNGGQNYGWRPREGFFDNPDFSDPTPLGAIDPIHAYDRGPAGAVIGGYVYRGDAIPGLQGTYFLADFEIDRIDSFRYDTEENVVSELTDRSVELASPLGSYGGIASFAEDAAGELYILDYVRGDIYRIEAAHDESGDYNGDGLVNAADYVVWRKGLGSEFLQSDYDVWRAHFGQTVSGSGAAVPEPTGVALLAAAGLALVFLCRRVS